MVAYDGAGFHGFAANAGVKTVGGTLDRGARAGAAATRSTLTCAGRTDAGVHAWGQVVTFDAASRGPRPRRAAAVGQQAVRAGDRRARGRAWRPPSSTPAARRRARRVPLHDPEPARARPVPRRHRLARRAAARPRRAAAGLRPAHRRARLLVVLPAPQACRRRRARWCAGSSTPVARPRRRRAALRDRGARVLPPDGAQRRRHAWSRSGSAGGGPARWRADPRARRTARAPASSPRPTACASGRSSTTESGGQGHPRFRLSRAMCVD